MHRKLELNLMLIGNNKSICAVLTLPGHDEIGHGEEAPTAEELVEKLKPFLIAKIQEQFQ